MAYEPEPRDWEDKATLYEKYWGELMSLNEVADELGTCRRLVRQEMDDFGIPVRGKGYRDGGTTSPFTGFYNGNENAQTDEKDRSHFDPDMEKDFTPQWQKIAEKDPAVGDAATSD